MAIRRCPYCKAIIDESLEYCSNCGTQLLFPEDETIEEDIPGEKIIDVNEEEKKEEPGPAKKNKPKEDQSQTPEELAENPDEEDKKDDEDTAEEFEKLVEEQEEEPKKEKKEKKEPKTAPDTGDIPTDELPIEKAIERELGRPPLVTPPTSSDFKRRAEETGSNAVPEAPEEIEESAGSEVKPPPKPKKPKKKESAQKKLTFDTDELVKAMDTTEKEKEEIERFLDSIKRDREQKAVPDAPSQDDMPPPRTDDEEAIPPWAAKMKETPPEDMSSLQDETREELIEEDKDLDIDTGKLLEEEAAAQDSGVGLPEDVGQQDLAIETEIEKEKRVLRKKLPSRFTNWLKSTAFDVVFIGTFWLIALWIASRVMDVSLFRLIAASTLSVLVFYGILLVSYLFLFRLFLGETLGDHLFFQD